MFESPVTVHTATRAPETISRPRACAQIRFYGASSTIASTSIEAIDAVRFAAFPNPHDSAAAAVESIDPRWSIQVIDSVRFAKFETPHAVAVALAAASAYTITSASAARHASPSLDDEQEIAIGELEQPSVTVDEECQDSNSADKGLEQILPPDEPTKDDHNRLHPVVLSCNTPHTFRPIHTTTSGINPHNVTSCLLDFERNPAFVRQREQARQRRTAAGATSKTPIWKP
ncbi:hypothetical protein PF007_g872 [Phytophthora fragariae]|uniref:Uncharacterized protein n=1 Tax=Phytophthora fragariae TaxID=53985 RepID=A0A6A3FX05_9STRA|nr:hypothetical protein PF003_g17944 [Phytophthora fragariae]KAE8949433.1 hypothetical protein PF009_g1012 [Phytophthora fragariae]KAE9139814.1 hypothetical protein PF007_g872 [Phytophthora fragariae]